MSMIDKTKNGVYIIAEMSANHAGNLNNALELVRAAKDSGADCLKIQTYTADTITIDCDNEYFKIDDGLWKGYTYYDLYKYAYTPWEWHGEIKQECEMLGLDFLSTPFDFTAVDYLESIDLELYKVASFEIVDIPLIKYIAKQNKPMIISCGMASIDEIDEALSAAKSMGLSKDKIFLLKCTSEYPAESGDMNLATIEDMKKRFGVEVGLSDHSLGIIAPIISVSKGACIIEKHFTLSRQIENADSAFSTEPAEFKQMVEAIRDAKKMLGDVKYGVNEHENTSIKSRKSIFAVSDIHKGELFSDDNIKVIRPSAGLHPRYFEGLLNSISKKSYKKGDPISEDEVEEKE